jgi:uncharacterized membrane protein YfcA
VTWIEAFVVVLAGMGAGIINTVVGSGTLITFPVLLWVGLPPVAANVANNIGLAPGSLSGAVGYRGELSGSRNRILRYSFAALLGGVAGAILLVVLPPGIFRVVAPVLIAMALVLVVVEPWLGRRLEGWRQNASPQGTWSMAAAVFSTSVYGGYFGAGQGVILLAVMGLLMAEPLQQVNALKNVLQAVDNGASALMFAILAPVDWLVVLLLAGGAVVGGQIGAKVGRRLPANVLRLVIVVIGVAGIVQLVR